MKDDLFQTSAEKDRCLRKLIEEEHMETERIKKNVYTFYISAIGSIVVFCTLLLFVFNNAFAVFANLYLAKWSTTYSTEENADNRYYYLIMYLIFNVGQAISGLFGNFVLFVGLLKASTYLYKILLKNVLSWPMWLFDSTPVGRIINRFTTDIEVLDTYISGRLGMLILCVGRFISVILVIAYFTPICMAILVPAITVMYFAQKYFLTLCHQLKRVESINRSPLFSMFTECASGISSIRAFNFQDKFVSRLHRKADLFSSSVYACDILWRWLIIRIILFLGIIVFCTICTTIYQRETLGLGLVAFLITFSMQILKEMNFFAQYLMSVETSMVSVERIKEYVEYPQEGKRHQPMDEKHPQWPSNGAIAFENYKLKYRKDMELILKGISVKIAEHEKLGIVGRTGAGKSSLISGLLRIVEPHEGSIIIDGVNITNLGLKLLRSKLTVIPQDPVLFLGTVRFNLDPVGQYTDENIWNALKKAYLKDFVSHLPGKLEHEVEEGGSNFSFGQRQLICLARALLRKTKILILDEATASIDLETDDMIQTIIRTEFWDCTVLTIAHRVNTVQDYDRILVLESGQKVEFDSPKNLKNISSSKFYKMAKESGLL